SSAPAPLCAVGRKRYTLDVASMTYCNNHILLLNEVLILDLALNVEDFGAAWRGKLFLDSNQLIANNRHDACTRAQDIEIITNFIGQALEFVADLVPSKRGQTL